MLLLFFLTWHARFCMTWPLLSFVKLIISYSQNVKFQQHWIQLVVSYIHAFANSIFSGIVSLWCFLLILKSHCRILIHLEGFPAFPSDPYTLFVCIFNIPCIKILSLCLYLFHYVWSHWSLWQGHTHHYSPNTLHISYHNCQQLLNLKGRQLSNKNWLLSRLKRKWHLNK